MIWVRKTETTSGGYVDAAGNRYSLEWCVTMVTPDHSTPADHGYSRHESVVAAAETWGLSPYVAPDATAEFEQLTAPSENE